MKKFGLAIIVITAILSSSSVAGADEWDNYYYGDYSDSYSDNYNTDEYVGDSGYNNDIGYGYGDYSGYTQDYNNNVYYGGYDSGYTVPQETGVLPTIPQTSEKAPKKPSSVKALKIYKNNSTLKNLTVKSSSDNETAVHNKGAKKLFINNSKLYRNGSVSMGADYSKYYGIGSALRTTKGNTFVKNSEIRALGQNGCGVFSYNSGITYLADTKVNAKKKSFSLGANAGEIYGYDLKISAVNTAVSSVKNGKVILDKGELNGSNGVLIENSAVTAVNNYSIDSKKSSVSSQSGKSDLSIFKSVVSCASEYAFSIKNSSKKSVLNIVGNKVKNTKGGLFSVNGAKANIVLSNSILNLKNKNVLSCQGAAECSFAADSQKLNGMISCDSGSKLNMYLQNGSKFTGTVTSDNSSEPTKKCKLYIDESSEWVVTGNSHIDLLYNKGKIKDKKGNVVPIKATDGTQYAQGKSKYTITVENYFEKNPEKGYPKVVEWKDYQKSAPSVLGIKYTKKNGEEAVSEEKKVDPQSSEIKNTNSFNIYYACILCAAVMITAVCVILFVIKSRKK